MDVIKKTHYVHEKGKVTNVVWDIENVLKEGLEGRRERLLNGKKKDKEFVECVIETIDFVESFCDRYANALCDAGKTEDGKTISRIIRYGA